MCVIQWFNENSGAISAVATVALAILTWALLKVANRQAEATKETVRISEALRDIEKKETRKFQFSMCRFQTGMRAGLKNFVRSKQRSQMVE